MENLIGQVNNQGRRIPFRRTRVSLWNAMIVYFTEKRHEIVRRKDMIEYLRQRGYPVNTSIDTYRNYLHQAGYLRTIRRGQYIVENDIPLGLSVDECREQAYGINADGRARVVMQGTDNGRTMARVRANMETPAPTAGIFTTMMIDDVPAEEYFRGFEERVERQRKKKRKGEFLTEEDFEL